jgi:hypothetical protein
VLADFELAKEGFARIAQHRNMVSSPTGVFRPGAAKKQSTRRRRKSAADMILFPKIPQRHPPLLHGGIGRKIL